MAETEEGEANLRKAARAAIYKMITESAASYGSPDDVAALAEAYAWVTYPNNPHGQSRASS